MNISSPTPGIRSSSSSPVALKNSPVTDAASHATKHADNGNRSLLPEPVTRSRFIILFVAHLGAALALFLATTDATIVSTSLPTIAADLRASQTHYSWIGISYMLTQTAFQPLYPLFSHLVGRKVAVLFCSIFIFILGSALCGAAQTVLWLIGTRGVQGIGAGGIVNSVWVLTSDIVTPQEKNKWSQALSATWSASAVAGPLIGGVFCGGHSRVFSWRWAFYLNIPIGLLALCLMQWSLRYLPLERNMREFSWAALRGEFVNNFDFIGTLLLVVGTSCTVLGFSFAAQKGWGASSAILLLSIGPILLVSGVVYEMHTTRVAVLPSTLFRSRTEVIILFVSFFHNVAFNAGTFYLALYYQAVLGVTPLLCGVLMLPYSLGGALASVPIAFFNDFISKRTRSTSCYKQVIVAGLALSTLGFGLLILLNDTSTIIIRELYPLIAGIGIGMLFRSPFDALTNGMSSHDRSRATSAFFLVRFIGATSGLSIAGAVFESRLSRTMPSLSGLSVDFHRLIHIEPISLRQKALRDVSSAISWVWVVCVGCLGLACLSSLAIRVVPVERDTSACGEASETGKNEAEV